MSGVCRWITTVVVTSVVRLAMEVGVTNMTDGSYENPSSTNHEAARAWLDRCSPEYRAVLEQALHSDVEALGGGFLDSWQETRLRTEVAVGAFIEAEKSKQEWVDPCPSWDELRPHNIKPGSPHDDRLRARYEAGRAEHREDWTKWSVKHVTKMIQEEDDDGLIYRAMRKHIMRKLGLL